jgi:hypothetical protein
MGGLWLHVDHELPEKSEITQISLATGKSRGDVFLLIFKLWRWANVHWDSGTFPGVTPDTVADIVGANAAFWRAVEKAGWIQFTKDGATIPDWELRISPEALSKENNAERQRRHRFRNAKRNANSNGNSNAPHVTPIVTKNNVPDPYPDPDPNTHPRSDLKTVGSDLGNVKSGEVSQEEIEAATDLVSDLFERSGYSGDDGRSFWDAAFLVVRKKLPPAMVTSAAEGCKQCKPKNPPAYFRKILQGDCNSRGLELGRLIAGIVYPSNFSHAAPVRAALSMPSLANAFALPAADKDAAAAAQLSREIQQRRSQ